MQHHPFLRAHGGAGNALPDFVEQFGAESLQRGDRALFERVLEVGHAVHLEFLVEQLDPLGTETRDAQQVEQPRRNRGDELLALGQGARRDERRDLLRDAAADPRQVRQVELPTRHELRNRIGVIGDGARRIAIRAHLERIARRDFQQVGDVAEETGDFGVLHAVRSTVKDGR